MKTAEQIIPEGRESFSPKEVAALLEHHTSTVNRWCQSGEIEARKPKGRWRITRKTLVELLVSFGIATFSATSGTPPDIGNGYHRAHCSHIAQTQVPARNAAKRQETGI